jgi:hypothetical protein
MARRTPEIRKKRVGYAETRTESACGSWIKCGHCGYVGMADVVLSTVLHTGGIERCPGCKSIDFEVTMETDMDEKTWKQDEWTRCYPSSWKGLIVPDAMAHPAKFSSRLIRRIYAHMKEEGWLQRGDTVIDPFGGVALGALDAMRMGLKWRGVELEAKFVELGNWNISNWNAKFAQMPKWSGDAVLLQGDSRKLGEVLRGEWKVESGKWKVESGEGVVSSPPYADGAQHTGGKDSRPEFMQGGNIGRYGVEDNYGDTPGQLAGMKDDGFDAAISSPPFRHSEGGTPEPKPGGVIDERLYARHAAGNSAADGYGVTAGQLANMGEGDFDAAVSSPPFEDNLSADYVSAEGRRNLARSKGISNAEFISPIDMDLDGVIANKYAGVPSVVETVFAAKAEDDFWMAARAIVEQVFLALAPGAHACWVVKGFVKNKQYVDFPDQWRQLCEAVGFVTVHEHRALLVNVKGTSRTLDGEDVIHKTESKSFFRRLAEKKGSPRIDYETVWCMEKPSALNAALRIAKAENNEVTA